MVNISMTLNFSKADRAEVVADAKAGELYTRRLALPTPGTG